MHFPQQNERKKETTHRTQENDFFQICLDEISYDTPGKKHFWVSKMSPASHSFFVRKQKISADKNIRSHMS
jgi:hypothetical protein